MKKKWAGKGFEVEIEPGRSSERPRVLPAMGTGDYRRWPFGLEQESPLVVGAEDLFFAVVSLCSFAELSDLFPFALENGIQ